MTKKGKGKKTMVDLAKIKKVVLSSDLPDTFNGVCKSIEEKGTKEGGKSLSVVVTITEPKEWTIIQEGKRAKVHTEGMDTVIMYRLPKALTGRGQGDMLLRYMRDSLGFTDTAQLIGNHYVWERHSITELGTKLPPSFTENPRHYPIKKIGQAQI